MALSRVLLFIAGIHINCVLFGIVEGCPTMTRQDYTYSEAWGGFYKVHGLQETWERATTICQMEGATLAMPYSTKGAEILSKIVTERRLTCGVFIGAKESQSRGDYRTIDGVPLCQIPHHWANEEPNAMVSSCLVLLPDGTFADEPCTDTMPFVCYKKDENNGCRNQCRTSDNAYKFNQRTGSCYKFHNIPLPWGAAVKTCADEGGHLAIINSATESKVLKDLFEEYPPNSIPGATHTTVIHIGFHNLFRAGDWWNVDGKDLSTSGFNTWSPGQPDNAGKSEACGSIFRSGLLNDVGCNAKCAFVCEIETGQLGLI